MNSARALTRVWHRKAAVSETLRRCIVYTGCTPPRSRKMRMSSTHSSAMPTYIGAIAAS